MSIWFFTTRQDALDDFSLFIDLETYLQRPSVHWFILEKKVLRTKARKREEGGTERWAEGHGEKGWSLLWSSARSVERMGRVRSAPLLSSRSENHTCRQSRPHLEPSSSYLLCSLRTPGAINQPCVNPAPPTPPPWLHPYPCKANPQVCPPYC